MSLLLLVTTFLFASLVTTLYLLVFMRAKQKRALEQRAIISASLDELKNERDDLKLKLWAEVERARDLERKKIRQELHDGLGYELTQTQYSISLMKKHTLTPVEQRALSDLSNSIADLSRKIRLISAGNSAERIDEIGLTESLCEFLRKKDGVSGISIHFEALGTVRELLYPRALALFRLVQEIVTNSLKHAKCQNLWVRLFWEEDRIVLEAEDDGQTDGSKVASKSIRRRVDELNIKIVNLDQFKGLHVQIIFEGW